ncbi:hypothetical protein WME76_45545 (plasmid) [Sorangium sp. So ce119]|uniref:hypothetical protein n=1 Tax=Sorangium sp. So ce119 TaxID=3133279 RepID=UPI003F5E5232
MNSITPSHPDELIRASQETGASREAAARPAHGLRIRSNLKAGEQPVDFWIPLPWIPLPG